MKRYALQLCLVMMAYSLPVTASEIGRQGEIMRVGTFHGDEVPAVPGRGWLALLVNEGSAELKSVKPKIKTVFDGIMDREDDPANYSGKEVVLTGLNPLLLIQVKGLMAGKVEQARITEQSDGQRIDFMGQLYRVVQRCKAKDPENGIAACQVFLDSNGATQWLGDTVENPDSDYSHTLTILWAGDLDRDGKLDLIIEKSRYNNSDTVLMLSSAAKKKQMLRQVAVLSQQGC